MFCGRCGASVVEGWRFCNKCGAPVQGESAESAIPLAEEQFQDSNPYASYDKKARPTAFESGRPPKIESFIVGNALMCGICLPLGVIGLVYGVGAEDAKKRGDWETAARKAKVARSLYWSVLIILVLGIIGLVVAGSTGALD